MFLLLSNIGKYPCLPRKVSILKHFILKIGSRTSTLTVWVLTHFLVTPGPVCEMEDFQSALLYCSGLQTCPYSGCTEGDLEGNFTFV